MVEVKRNKYPLNPTLKLVDKDGRATSEFFRILKAIGEIIGTITIEDGEVTADMITVDSLEAISAVLGNVVINGNLLVLGSVTTSKVAINAISELTALTQTGSAGPNGDVLIAGTVPIVQRHAGHQHWPLHDGF